MAISVGQMRWMGLGAVLGGALMVSVRLVDILFGHPGRVASASGGSLRFEGTVGALILVILATTALLSILGVLGLRVQQRGHTGKSGSAGFVLLLAGFASVLAGSALSASTIVFDLTGRFLGVLLALLGSLPYILMIPLGFLLLGIGLPRPSRRVPLIVGLYLVIQPWVWLVLQGRLASVSVLFGSEMSSIVVGLGVAGIGWMLWSGVRARPVQGASSLTSRP